MSTVVGEVIAVSGIRISLRIFEDSSQETIFYEGVKYRGVSLREHISIQRGFIDIVCLVEGEYLDERRMETDAEKTQYIRKVDVRPIGYIVDDKFFEGVKFMPPEFDTNPAKSLICIGRVSNAPLHKGQLSVQSWLLDLQCGQGVGLFVVDGGDAGDRRCVVDAYLVALDAAQLLQRRLG